MNRVFSLRVVAIGTTVLLIAALSYAISFGVWANRNLVDSDTFAETTVAALTEESSREALANLAVDQLVETAPVLEPIAAPMKEAVAGALGSDRLGTAFVSLAARLHAIFFDGSSDGLVIDLSGIRELVVAAVAAVSPRLAERVPEGVYQSIEIVEPGTVPELSPALDAVRKLLWLALVLLVVTLAAVVWLTRARSTALLMIGAGLTISGAITALIVPGGRAMTLGSASNPDVEVLMANLYDHAVVGLKTQSRLILLLGIALLAGGYLMRRRATAA